MRSFWRKIRMAFAKIKNEELATVKYASCNQKLLALSAHRKVKAKMIGYLLKNRKIKDRKVKAKMKSY